MDYDLWTELYEALNQRLNPEFYDVNDASLFGALACEVAGSTLDNSPDLFVVQVSVGYDGLHLLWGFRDTTFRLRTIWLTDGQTYKLCQRCARHHKPKATCSKEPVETRLVTTDQVVPDILANIDKVLEDYASPYANQPVEQADIARLLELLVEKWYQARAAKDRRDYYHHYEPLLYWGLYQETNGGNYTLTWVEHCNQVPIEKLKLSAYQEDGKWRIDFHYNEFDLLQVFEPYQFEDQVGSIPSSIIQCQCCPDAPMVKPDIFSLRTALARIWEDIEIRLQERRDRSPL